jgi:hypothetical protein
VSSGIPAAMQHAPDGRNGTLRQDASMSAKHSKLDKQGASDLVAIGQSPPTPKQVEVVGEM